MVLFSAGTKPRALHMLGSSAPVELLPQLPLNNKAKHHGLQKFSMAESLNPVSGQPGHRNPVSK